MNYNLHFLYTTVIKDLDDIPPQVKMLLFGIFIYTLGWGLIEPFLSVYINHLFDSYFVVGMLFAIFFFVAMLFSAPIGDLADKMSNTKIIPWMMFTYPFIAILYYLGSVFTGILSIGIIFAARALNGFSATLWVVVEAFVRQNSPARHTAGIFGLFFTIQNLAFVLGLLVSTGLIIMYGISFEHLGLLFFGLLFTPIIAGLYIMRIPSPGLPLKTAIREVIEKDKVYKREIHDFRHLGNAMTTVVMQGYFMTALVVLGKVFLPLLAASTQRSLLEIAILAIIVHIPLLFSFILSEIADRTEKFKFTGIGFGAAAVLLVVVALFVENTPILYASAFLLGIVFAMLQPAVNALLTEITPQDEKGEMTGVFHSVANISNAINSLLIGTLAALFGITAPFIVFAFLLVIMAFASFTQKSNSQTYQKGF